VGGHIWGGGEYRGARFCGGIHQIKEKVRFGNCKKESGSQGVEKAKDDITYNVGDRSRCIKRKKEVTTQIARNREGKDFSGIFVCRQEGPGGGQTSTHWRRLQKKVWKKKPAKVKGREKKGRSKIQNYR